MHTPVLSRKGVLKTQPWSEFREYSELRADVEKREHVEC